MFARIKIKVKALHPFTSSQGDVFTSIELNEIKRNLQIEFLSFGWLGSVGWYLWDTVVLWSHRNFTQKLQSWYRNFFSALPSPDACADQRKEYACEAMTKKALV